MARLTKDQWQTAKERWESDPDLSHEALANEIGVSRPAVIGYAKRNGWKKRNVTDVTDVTKNVTGNVASQNTSEVAKKINDIFKSGHGGAREGAGRPTSVQTQLRLTLKERAAQYGDDVITMLAEIVNNEEMPANFRIAAGKELLDRGFGKAQQYIEVSADIQMIDKAELDARYERNLARTKELAIKTQERIAQLNEGALH